LLPVAMPLPPSDVRGEGVFLRVPELLLAEWEARISDSPALENHRRAYRRLWESRYSGRVRGVFRPDDYWPGALYIALHTLSHLLSRAIALDCGYYTASLSEPIYAGNPDNPHGGILIYTAVPDAEGIDQLSSSRRLAAAIAASHNQAWSLASDPSPLWNARTACRASGTAVA
jgi:hypothetical protein